MVTQNQPKERSPAVKKVRRKLTEKEFIERINIPKIVCIHLIGENHTSKHRMAVGAIVMGFGVVISKITANLYILSFCGDVIGYLIHGIGSIPFVEHLSSIIASANKVTGGGKEQS